MPPSKYGSRSKLLYAAISFVANDLYEETNYNPTGHEDAESELQNERLLIAAREYVAAHADVTPIGG